MKARKSGCHRLLRKRLRQPATFRSQAWSFEAKDPRVEIRLIMQKVADRIEETTDKTAQA
jgi:hypothetical protein